MHALTSRLRVRSVLWLCSPNQRAHLIKPIVEIRAIVNRVQIGVQCSVYYLILRVLCGAKCVCVLMVLSSIIVLILCCIICYAQMYAISWELTTHHHEPQTTCAARRHATRTHLFFVAPYSLLNSHQSQRPVDVRLCRSVDRHSDDVSLRHRDIELEMSSIHNTKVLASSTLCNV